MPNVAELQRKRKESVDTMRSIHNEAEKREDTNLTEEEQRNFDAALAETEKLDKQIERQKNLEEAEARTAVPAAPNVNTGQHTDEFRTLGEFIKTARENPGDSRVQTRSVEGSDSLSYLIPDQWMDQIAQLSAPMGVVREKAFVIGAGERPDAAVEMPYLDQSGDKGVYSGVAMNWRDSDSETDRASSGMATVGKLKLEPKELSGYVDVSEKNLNNSAVLEAMLINLMAGAKSSAEEHAFITGDGVGKPLGAYVSDAPVEITRNTADQINYIDVINMYSRRFPRGSYEWVINTTALPQIMQLQDGAGNNLWQPDAGASPQGTLLGIPVRISEFVPTVGNTGDISLVDWGKYIIKDGSPMGITFDPYTQKLQGNVRIYAVWNVDGQPWVKSPLLQEDGSTTVSPIVKLA